MQTNLNKLLPTSTWSLGLWGLIIGGVSVVGFLVWASTAELEAGATAIGEVTPAGQVKTVQHLEGGIISEILVKDGDYVKEGQPLLLLDDNEAKASLAILDGEAKSLRALISRLQAERDGRDLEPLAPEDLTPTVETQFRIFEVRRAALKQGVSILEQRIKQTEEEVAGLDSERKALSTMLGLSKEEAQNTQDLYTEKYVEKRRLFELQSKVAEIDGLIGRNVAETSQARQKVIETREQIAKLKSDWLDDVLNNLHDAQEKYTQTEEKVHVAEDRLKRMKVVAPQEGIVHGLRFTTKGGVIPPREVIMNIIPTTANLIVEAKISPDDIDVVRPGLIGHVRLTAYKYRTHGTLLGTVTRVSADTFTDNHSGMTYYKAEIEIGKDELGEFDRMELYPGMLATVDIVSGKRTVLRYLLEPITDSLQKAFKEE